MKQKWWLFLSRLENEFDYQMFENSGWKWLGGILIGLIIMYLLK